MSRVANFCPNCGTALELKDRHGRLRPVCPACGFIFYHDPKVAVVAVVIKDDKVLLVKRAFDPGKGKWACPAGFVDYDEPPSFAVVRETYEETGLRVQSDHVLQVFPKKDHGLANIVIAYRCSVLGGTLQAGDDAEQAQWFTRDQLPELVFYPSITLIGIRWRNGKL